MHSAKVLSKNSLLDAPSGPIRAQMYMYKFCVMRRLHVLHNGAPLLSHSLLMKRVAACLPLYDVVFEEVLESLATI